MLTPNPSNENQNSPAGETPLDDEIIPQFNPATQNRPVINEEEWLYLHPMFDIEPQFNPVTQSLGNLEDE